MPVCHDPARRIKEKAGAEKMKSGGISTADTDYGWPDVLERLLKIRTHALYQVMLDSGIGKFIPLLRCFQAYPKSAPPRASASANQHPSAFYGGTS
jgi:hypothetical protein